MLPRRAQDRRRGRCHPDYPVILALIILMTIAAIACLGSSQSEASANGGVWEVVKAVGKAYLYTLGVLVGLSLALGVLTFVVETIERLRQARAARRLTALRSKIDAGNRPTEDDLRAVVPLLQDSDASTRQQAVQTAWCLLRANPNLGNSPTSSRQELEKAFLEPLGFTTAVREAGKSNPLPALVTLGAKVGAGTMEKRISSATSDPAVLARWIVQHQDGTPHQELQVSIGYDTGTLSFQADRGKFIALYLFIASTDLKRFQALTHKPSRDPGAAYGLLIRGENVEVKYPGQAHGRRLDYVFPLPRQMSEGSLADFLRQFQLLNLGLLLAVVEDSCRALSAGAIPPWLDARMRRVAQAYRHFERRLVLLLRQYDRYRDPALIYPLHPADHRERQTAFRTCRLEECLYPSYTWVVPLYAIDTGWDRLLGPLRAIEGMMLHQGPVEGRPITRGLRFIHEVRLLGYETASAIQDLLAEPAPAAPTHVLVDPFIDPADESATKDYLRTVRQAIRRGQVALADLPDPVMFAQAVAYYRVGDTIVPA